MQGRWKCLLRLSTPLVALCLSWPAVCTADETFLGVGSVEQQPLAAATTRLIEALDYVGSPLRPEDRSGLERAMKQDNPRQFASIVQQVLDPYCVAGVTIYEDHNIALTEGPAKKELVQDGWRTFLVKVKNLTPGFAPPLKIESPNLAPSFQASSNEPLPKPGLSPAEFADRWMDAALFVSDPLKRSLSGLGLEYGVILLYSRDRGRREARLGLDVGTEYRPDSPKTLKMSFQCLPAVDVVLRVVDFDGKPTTAGFVVRDKSQRIYPNPVRRTAPDFFFQNQVYRADGEVLRLPPGEFTIEVSRGPEYLVETHKLSVEASGASQTAEFRLRRWAHAAERGWYSGDHHIHAAGCKHYDNPTEGVSPADMIRHIVGEDLNVGAVLAWGPCWYSQKRNFEGRTSAHSRASHLLRYDVEVSGFPSSHAGHLCLLGLTEDDYPKTKLIEEWPSWTQPVLEWARKQGAVVGYAHSGLGLQLPDFMPDGSREFVALGGEFNWAGKPAEKLPDYALPRFDGVGANEYIVTTTMGACDFISVGDTPAPWELNIWYHALNCGMTTRISGETDFPCISGDRVGVGRSYVKLRLGEELTYENWLRGIKAGRSYCGDGKSHIFDFRVDELEVGQEGSHDQPSLLSLAEATTVTISCEAAAFLASPKPTKATEAIRQKRLDRAPYWDLERARRGDTRDVPVELIVNGKPMATKLITADGQPRRLTMRVPLRHSSWVALRVFPSCHTNPMFIEIGGKPIRASRKSARWCLDAVDICWKAKKGSIRGAELAAAEAAYEHARATYAAIAKEAVAD